MSIWMVATPYALTLGLVLALYIVQRYHKSIKHLPLPPGPLGLPWIGNVIGIDANAPWVTYSDWSKIYGDLIYSRLMGKDIIVINSEKAARDLLENRSRNYSDRPYFVTNELCGIGFNTGLMPYGDRWRLHRQFFHQTFRADGVSRFLPSVRHKSCQLLRRLLDDPKQLTEHIFEYTASVILNGAYDYDPSPAPEKDEIIDMVVKVIETIAQVVTPGMAIVVSAIPAVLQLPSWFPGMSFKEKMKEANAFSAQYVERPFARCLENISSGHVTPSMVHDALQSMEKKGISPDESWIRGLKGAAATAFIAGSETSNSTLMTFFLLMTANPAMQEKAQTQIDAIVGKARLPSVEDRPSLPYVDAILREVLRFSPPAPLAVPRATVEDDAYAGFHIPKGAIIMTNLWAMSHNESKYPNPHEFLPERFLNDDGSLKPNDLENIVFGFGRRICVGRYLADASVWLAIAKVLSVFRILKSLDENGDEIPVELKFTSGLAIHPLPFQCRIMPRAPGMDMMKLEELILASSN